MSINQVKQCRPRQNVNHAKFNYNAYTYKIIEVPVRAIVFVSIHDITKRGVQTLQKSGKALGAAPKDKCGKYNYGHSKKPPHIKTAVKEHIASLKGNPIHYSIGASKKLYLPPELNVDKMHQMCKDKGLPVVSYEYYRKIFNLHFNIKFEYTRSDTCSTCDKFQEEIRILEERIKTSLNEEERNIILKEERKLRKHSTPEKELQKPGEEHKHITKVLLWLSKKISVYPTFPNIIDSFFYCYDETIGGKGADEAVSMLDHFIFTQLKQEVKHLEIFCDNCGGQNKNYTVVRYLHYIVHNTRILDSIKVTFPIRGHSYLECDRNMALIQLKTPAELHEHWWKHFSVARMKPSAFHIIEVGQALIRA
ncbi:hypothetical protein PR048_019320 [Dryococelus australis]|uniref:DUF7869 domain-containing protein n=1 Tax=Dryococelus australis TaxID=614101 RepID=A0ABQ9H376_9NEOP|nr:hypothetical protein PR048_019320 [Dryococelus australis]